MKPGAFNHSGISYSYRNHHVKANSRKEFSCSCRELSWKAHSVDAIFVTTNTHSIGSDCHWLFISGHEEITRDGRWYYPPCTQERLLHVMCHVGETSVKLYSCVVIICHIWSTYRRILPFVSVLRTRHKKAFISKATLHLFPIACVILMYGYLPLAYVHWRRNKRGPALWLATQVKYCSFGITYFYSESRIPNPVEALIFSGFFFPIS